MLSGLALIDEAVEKYNPVGVFGLFSGGHDSLCATHLASQHPLFLHAVHINTGIGIEQTREFVRDTCKQQSWRLREYRAQECGAETYEEMVLAHGFPGPFAHRMMYTMLKERALRQLVRDFKVGDCPLLLVSGARSQESTRRMGTTEPIQKDGRCLWVAAIHDWAKDDCNKYIADKGLDRNEVVDLIHKSGECLCGAFAKRGELAELAMWFPEEARRIAELRDRVWDRFPWGWEDRPPKWWLDKKHGQEHLFDMASLHPCNLCWSCDKGGK